MIELLAYISKHPIIGNPDLDTTIYGVIEDKLGAQLFWGVGWGGGLGHEWAMIEWDEERMPASRIVKDVFSILDELEIDGRLESSSPGDKSLYI